MLSFLYQYSIMWVVFLVGCALGVRHGELALSGPRAPRLWLLFGGMMVFTAFHACFTPWGTW